MDVGSVVALGQKALWMVTLLAGPLLVAGLVVGLVVSLLQATTQMNDQTLSFVPKIAVVLVAAAVAGPWMLQTLIDFSRGLLLGLPGWIH